MARLVYISLFILLSFSSYGQHMAMQAEVWVENINLRLEEAVVLQTIDIDIPTAGKVLVKFEGNIDSDKGDVITLAASNLPSWDTNDGNVGAYVYDSLHHTNAFVHTRVYSVDSGQATYYAVAQNWTDRNGNGMASIKGKLSVEFYPNTSISDLLFTKGVIIGPILLNEEPTFLDSLQFITTSKGKAIVYIEGSTASLNNAIFEMATSLNDQWNNEDENIIVYHSFTDDANNICFQKVYDIEEGMHQIKLWCKKIQGNMTSLNNAFYLTFRVEFLSSDDKNLKYEYTHVNKQLTLKQNEVNQCAELSLTSVNKGILVAQFSGSALVLPGDKINFYMAHRDTPSIELAKVKVASNFAKDSIVYFSLTAFINAGEEPYNLVLLAVNENSISNSISSIIKGSFSLKWIGETSTHLSDQTISSNAEVYPNPVNDRLFIELNSKINDNEEILIIDALGRIADKIFIKPDSGNRLALDVTPYPKGQYFIKISQQQSLSSFIKTGN